MPNSVFYSEAPSTDPKFTHRFTYTTQLIVARKFSSKFSMELLPTLTHRNFIVSQTNFSNGSIDQNDIFSMGGAARLKLTKRFAVLVDYFYNFSKSRQSNTSIAYYNPLGIGVEIETGGHVFHINLTNASGIVENDFIPNTTDSWWKGGFKLGFTISRVFGI